MSEQPIQMTAPEVLSSIEQARKSATKAEGRLRGLVAAAMNARADSNGDLTADQICAAAGIGRQTGLRWAREAATIEAVSVVKDPANAMDDALIVLLAASAGPRHEVLAGLRTTDLTAKARCVEMAAKNTTGGQIAEAADRETVVAGCAAASRVLRKVGR